MVLGNRTKSIKGKSKNWVVRVTLTLMSMCGPVSQHQFCRINKCPKNDMQGKILHPC